MFELQDMKPPRFQWLNESALARVLEQVSTSYPDHEYWEDPSLAFSWIPTPRLLSTDPDYSPNLLETQFYKFASNRLRKALDLDQSVIRYCEIDSSACADNVKTLQLAAFDVIRFGNPLDPARMKGTERDVRQNDGTLHREWVVDYQHMALNQTDSFFRPDFVAPAPLFRCTGTFWILATDELAERVMRAGITDILFTNYSGNLSPGESWFRKLE